MLARTQPEDAEPIFDELSAKLGTCNRTSRAPNPDTSERLPDAGNVEVQFPGAPAIKMEMVTKRSRSSAHELAALHVAGNDWFALRVMSLWLFHTPPGVTGLPPRVPVVASTRSV